MYSFFIANKHYSDKNYEEDIDFIKEKGVKKPFKCMKCDHKTDVKAHKTRHIFTKHSSAVRNRKRKAVPAKPAKETRSEVVKERTVSEPYMRKEMIKRFRKMIERRDSTNEALEEDNRKLNKLVTHSAQVITHLEMEAVTETE